MEATTGIARQMTGPTPTLKAVKDALWTAGIYDVLVTRLQKNAIRVRHSYYYHPSQSIECFSERIQLTLTPLGLETIRVADEQTTWPKTSYYTVEMRSHT